MLVSLLCLLVAALPSQESDRAKNIEVAAGAALDRLPGHTGFAFTELVGEEPRLVAGVRQEERFAIGSSFKLYILATLANDANTGRRKMDEVARLNPDWVGPPHSEMAEWPAESPVTLHTLALKMIWISDNTATDNLLHQLGREHIEQQIRMLVPQHANWNIPLMSTREMTSLRDKKTGLLGRAYQKLDEAGKRKLLADHVQGRPDYEALDFDASAFDLAEWYATPLDMAKTLAWIKTHSEEGQPANPVRGILAVDPKLEFDAKVWPYVGFKGGSEDNLLAGNWLLKHNSGRWYTMHVYWNNTEGKAEPEKLLAAIAEIFAVINE